MMMIFIVVCNSSEDGTFGLSVDFLCYFNFVYLHRSYCWLENCLIMTPLAGFTWLIMTPLAGFTWLIMTPLAGFT